MTLPLPRSSFDAGHELLDGRIAKNPVGVPRSLTRRLDVSA